MPLALHTGAAVRELDRIAIEESGIAGITLMRRAAQACADVVQQCWPAAEVVRVFCGSGNNAGDGYLLAGLLAQRGLKVEAIVVGDILKLGADALAAYQFCEQSDATIQPLSEVAFADGASLFVDALLGIGLSGLVRADFAKVITRINEHSATKGLPVLSVDIPSGLSADNGQVLGVAIRATATVTFIGTKRGLLTGDGTDMVGELYFDDLGVPVDVLKRVPATALRLSNESLAGLLPRRLRNSHKNRFGHILVVGGDQGMGGAVRVRHVVHGHDRAGGEVDHRAGVLAGTDVADPADHVDELDRADAPPRLRRRQPRDARTCDEARARGDRGAALLTLYVGPVDEDGKGAPHAHLLEFGTGPRYHKSGKFVGAVMADPFMRPAWDQHRGQMLEKLGANIWAEIEKSLARAERAAAKG